jgi:PAS domain S-box-containing protein
MVRSRQLGDRSHIWAIAGLVTLGAVAIVDAITGTHAVLVGVLVAAPLLASAGATTRQTEGIAALSVAVSVPLAVADDIWGTSDYYIALAVLLIGGCAAVVSARLRERRDAELAITRPQAVDASRLRLALEAAQMGTWQWDLPSGRVTWDEQLEAMYGLAPGTFDGRFETYQALLHADDRERVARAVNDGIQNDKPWHFDHRVTWPDGTVHWLEGRGEPWHDDTGTVVGASGVTINVDERHARLDADRRGSETIRSIAEITAVLAAASTADEVADVIVTRAAATLGARSGYFAIVDEQTRELVLRGLSGYTQLPDGVERIGLDAPMPVTYALNDNKPIFCESPEERERRFPDFLAERRSDAFVCVPLTAGPMRAAVSFGFAHARVFDAGDRSFVRAVTDACEQALRRANAFESEQAAQERLQTLLVSSEALGKLDDPNLVVETVASLAATRLGVWAAVTRVMPNGRFERGFVTHRDPALEPLLREVLDRLDDAGTSVGQVLKTGEPVVYDGFTDTAAGLLGRNDELRANLRRVGYSCCMMVPIAIAGRRLAALLIGYDRPGPLRDADIELAIDLGRRGGSALERAALWQASQERYEAEHRTVEVLQRTIVPDRLPDLAGIELAAAYRPAEVDVDVGGDWYDAFATDDGSLMLVVGDVAGHGIEAASLMGRVRNALRAYALEDTDPASVLARVHRLLRSQEGTAMVTAFVARIAPDGRSMTWSRAGHPPPALFDVDRNMVWLDNVNGAPLGTMVRSYATARVDLSPSSLLVCYTDGLVERRDRILDEGLNWLAERVKEYAEDDLATLCDKLVDDPFVPHPSPDDVCVLAMRTERRP